MVYLVPFLGAAALLSNLVLAVPTPGSGSSSESSLSSESRSSSSSSSSASASSASASSDCSGSGCGSFGSVSESNNSSSDCGESGCGSSESSCEGDSCDNMYTSTSTAYKSYNTPMYGSGSNYNNYGSGYDDCISQCVAQFGGDAYTYTPTSTSESSDYSSTASVSSGSSGDSGSMGTNGVTHTVIVAPTAGVLRYVPFALNASVGDTIEFQWGADSHTVTHSSELLPCNKTADSPFTSGVQPKGFVYHQAVTTTDPVFYYCGVPTHCQKGMFGIINPPVNLMAPTSVGNMMQDMMSSNDDIKTYAVITASKVGDLGPGASWGNAIDIGNMTADNQASVISNVLYTRNVLAMNADTIWNNQTNAIDLKALSTGAQLMFPPDVGSALAQADVNVQASASDSASASVVGATNSASAPSASASGKGNSGAGALASPKMLVAFVAIAATVMAL